MFSGGWGVESLYHWIVKDFSDYVAKYVYVL